MSPSIKHAETSFEIEGARALRLNVFVEEQGISRDIELDSLDDTAYHAIALQDGAVVGTGRLVIETPTHGRIGRMAIDRQLRRRGIGRDILAFLEEKARSSGIQFITLHSQSYIKSFYFQQGYQEEGCPFVEAGISHVQMTKALL